MIEKAFVSGQIGQTIFKEEDKLFILNAKDTKRALECTPYDMNLFFNIDAEIKIFENINFEDLRKKFLKEKACFDALYGAIGGFDPNLSEETQILSIQRAENLIEDPEILDFVKFRLYGNPVPQKAALMDALIFAIMKDYMHIFPMYNNLLFYGKVIDHIISIFKKVIFELHLDKEYVKIKNQFITTGIFAKLFLSIIEDNFKNSNELVDEFGGIPGIKGKIPSISQILTRMMTKIENKPNLDQNPFNFSDGSKRDTLFTAYGPAPVSRFKPLMSENVVTRSLERVENKIIQNLTKKIADKIVSISEIKNDPDYYKDIIHKAESTIYLYNKKMIVKGENKKHIKKNREN